MRVPLLLTVLLALVAFVSSARCGDVTGQYANRLSTSDIAQIKAAIAKERGISHNIKKIEAIRSERVAVQTATRSGVDEDTLYDFNVNKHSGTWTIDLSSVVVSIEKRDFRTNGPAFSR